MKQTNRATKPIEGPTAASTDISHASGLEGEALLKAVIASLEDDKAEEMVVIDLAGKASFADYMVIASGRSSRQVAAIAQHLAQRMKDLGQGRVPVEGGARGDWVLIDCGDVVVHLFRPEVREFYGLEKMWIEGFEPAETETSGDSHHPLG